MKKLILIFVLLSGFAFAVSPKDKGLFLDYLKLGCKDPAAVHNQIPPSDIKVFCEEEKCDWQAGPSTHTTRTNYKEVCGHIMTNKPNLGTLKECNDCVAVPTQYDLPTLVEVCSEVEMTFSITCEEVEKMTTVDDFCLKAVDFAIADNSEILSSKFTGRVTKAIMPEPVKK